MSTQPEAILENKLVNQLAGMGYAQVQIRNDDGIF